MKIKGLRLAPVLEAELDFVVKQLGCEASICDRCGARLSSYADKCRADLSDCCPGFLAIENVKAKFHAERRAGLADQHGAKAEGSDKT